MRGVVLICNYERTESVNLISKFLKSENAGFKLISIIHDPVARKLIDHSNFDLVIDCCELPNEQVNDDFGKSIDFDFEINRDRKLKHEINSKQKLSNFVRLIQEKLSVYSSLEFYGEISWAFEQVIYKYAQLRGFDYFTPIPLRYIDRRWAFAQGNTEENLIVNLNNEKNITEYTNTNSPPTYFNEGMKNFQFINTLLRFLRNGFRSNTPDLIPQKILLLILKPILEFFKKNNFKKNKNTKYLFYGFQVRPEASVDYLAPEFIDQSKVVNEIINNLKENEILILKDHPGETLMWYLFFKIKLLFNNKIVYLKTKSQISDFSDLIDGAITITGTYGGELSKLGVITVSLKKMFYNFLTHSFSATSVEQSMEIIRNADKSNLKLNNEEFFSFLTKNSMPGYPYYTNNHKFSDSYYISNFSSFILNRN